ncbi:MAG: hypothetical protein ACLSVG_11130 [Clostridia bacterium]
MTNIFYHATNKKLDELLPLSKKHSGDGRVCYFTPNRAYALFYIRDMEINHVTCGVGDNGIPVYYEQFPQQLKIMYSGRSGYIYTLINNGEIVNGHTNGVWFSTQPIKVASVSFVKDVYDEIIKAESVGEVQIIRYEDLSEEKKLQITEMICISILKHKYLSNDCAKSRFMKENFPEAWNMAKEKENAMEIYPCD